MAKIYRQGDVLIRRVRAVPKGCAAVPAEQGRVILAHGEATGHAHALDAETCVLVEQPATQRRFLTVEAQIARLLHEEHAPIELPAGVYEVIRQREWTLADQRQVAD